MDMVAPCIACLYKECHIVYLPWICSVLLLICVFMWLYGACGQVDRAAEQMKKGLKFESYRSDTVA